MKNMNSISASVQSGDAVKTMKLVSHALKENRQPFDILKYGLVEGIIKTEKRLRKNEILDSEFLVAERAAKAGIKILIPVIENINHIGTVITGTLEGDIREIEKEIISVMMQSLGLRVIDLGVSVSSIRFIEAAMEEGAKLIVCATSLTIFLCQMKSLVQAATQSNIRGQTKILFSGGPVTEQFCKSIDADIYAPDPVRAAEAAAEYCGKAR